MTGHSSCNLEVNNCEVVKKKERHIVSWSQEEDDILREQIGLHGSENWAIIASKFKDKTTRQCRRRWFTYLNSDFKKGGWSPEEDILLCEAQKIYGNRWTEIAKVVSGRTDNAVKNRFTTLCKKRAKREALVKVTSSTSLINLNNRRVIFRNGLNSDEGSENAAPLKKIRDCISSITDSHKHGETPAVECGAADHLLGHPLAAAGRNAPCLEVNHVKEALADKSVENRFLRTFLKKDDPKLLTLMQQAELLSSLAIKVNADMTDQSLENAWMVLEDFLRQSKECQMLKATNRDADFQLEKLKEDLRSCDEGSRSPWRELNAYESSPASSEYSTGSTLVSNVPCDKREERDAEIVALSQETGHVFEAVKLDQPCLSEENGVCHVGSTNEVKSIPTYEDVRTDKEAERGCTITEFSSPTRVTPLFTTLAAAIPSPKFSESEKHFLMKTLGLESSSPRPIMNPSQPPPCKRSLLHCL